MIQIIWFNFSQKELLMYFLCFLGYQRFHITVQPHIHLYSITAPGICMKNPHKLLRHEQDLRSNLKQEHPEQSEIEVDRENRKIIICIGFLMMLLLFVGQDLHGNILIPFCFCFWHSSEQAQEVMNQTMCIVWTENQPSAF